MPSWRTSSWPRLRSTSSPCAWPSQQRPQQQLADAEREGEQADDAGAVDLEAVDGHRGQRRGGELPREHRQVDGAEQLQPVSRRAASTAWPAIIAKLRMLAAMNTNEHRERVAAVVGERDAVQPLQRQAAEQREGRVGGDVLEQLDPARGRLRSASTDAAAMPIATAGAGPSSAIASTRPRNEPPIRKRLRLQHDEVAADHEHGEQADQLPRLPLLGRGEQHRRRDDAGQQQPPRRPPRSARGPRRRCAPLGGSGGASTGVGSVAPGRAHQRERPRHDDDPQSDGEPHDHTFKVVGRRRTRQPG